MTDPELETFKTSIDLRVYASGQGYVLDRKESWRGSAVMRHESGDKVIIKRDADGHYVYFSVRDATDHGTIIDFVQHRHKLGFGEVRKELRSWIGFSVEPLPFTPLLRTAKDRLRVERAYAHMQEFTRHPYLESDRAIPAALLQSERFRGRICLGQRGNAVFPHFDRDGLCGFEIKNTGFTGFSTGGSKGLWFSNERSDDRRLVFCEAAIDALSYGVLFADEHTRYASMGGQLSPLQRELIREACAIMPMNSAIIAATDSDIEGEKLGESVREAVTLTDRDDLRFELHHRPGFKDWNDQRNRPSRSIPPRLREPSNV